MLLFLIAGLLIASCGPAATPAPTATASASRTPIRLGPTSTASSTPTRSATLSPTATLAPLPTVAPDEPALGPEDAAVELLLYIDYDCDPCLEMARTLTAAQQRHSDRVRLVVRPFPLVRVNDKAVLAASAVISAAEQRAFWIMHDHLVSERPSWRELTPAEFATWLGQTAPDLGLDAEKFRNDLRSEAMINRVRSAYERTLAAGIPGAPFLLIDRQPYLLGPEPTNIEAVLRLSLLESRQYDSEPPITIDSEASYSGLLILPQGEVRLQLYPGLAPRAVNSFRFLADQGWYDGSGFHRVVPGRLAEAGDPSLTGLGHAGYHFPLEIQPGLRFNQAGRVALDNDGPDTNSARFFITMDELPALDGSYTIFGTVTQGLDLIRGLESREPIDDIFEPPELLIDSIEVTSP